MGAELADERVWSGRWRGRLLPVLRLDTTVRTCHHWPVKALRASSLIFGLFLAIAVGPNDPAAFLVGMGMIAFGAS